MPFHDRQFAVRLHAATSAIQALRDGDGNRDTTGVDGAKLKKARFLAQAWAVFYVTGLAHSMGGTQGEAMASVADQHISPDECLTGFGSSPRPTQPSYPGGARSGVYVH